jgi:excinuclease ABC subunit A
MSLDKITIRGARQHNLKNIDLEIPRDKFVVITGVSGSGKSSLAFDTIYAEGQRRYVESLSAYARQFLAQMDKPDVDSIEGLSPAVSIDQKSATRNPRSTVATVTEIYDHLRLLFARIGKPHCPSCGRPIAAQSVEQIVDRVEEMPEGTRIMILGPVIRGRKGEYRQIFDDIRKQAFARVRVDGAVRELSDPTLDRLERYKQHDIDIVVDRLVVRPGIRQRVADSLETALRVGQGAASVAVIHDEQETAPPAGAKGKGLPRTFAAKAASDEISFSEKFACLPCGKSFDPLEPRMFSFNSPYGACPECAGLGTKNELDEELVIPDKNLSLAEGAVLPWRHEGSRYYSALLRSVCEEYDVDMNRPVKDLPKRALDLLLNGTEEMVRVRFRGRGGRLRVYDTYFRGVLHYLNREYQESETDYMREEMEKYMRLKPCPACKGARLKPESLAVTIKELNIAQVAAMSVEESARFFGTLDLSEREQMISQLVLKEIKTRLSFLLNVGLSYLTLDRPAATLAGGEGQRIRLATQIGSGLMGVLYILDEPSIGLHQRDNRRLLDTLERLRDLGNTILVVEHDEATIRTADHIIDIGPGAGERGGHVVATGTVEDLANCPESITGQYLIGRKKIETPERRRVRSGRHLIIKGARHHNLKNIDVKIPLGVFVCVTGVSGSGKSSLIDETLYRRLAHKLHGARTTWGTHDGILGVQEIDKVINIDQSPIGRTPRSNPATYTGAFDPIRYLFAQTPEARMRGYKPGRFSFNVKGGRCEACRGDGIIKIEMVFLPDVYVPCETCKGNRYNRETLEVRYKGKNIADVLNMTVAEAVEYFRNIPAIARKLQTIHDVGLDYIKLGQPATTLSGGEAQRVKLATELSRRSTGRTLYLLDEPTTGLHFDDMKKLLDVLNRLVDAGNTVVVIEHNLDVIKTADHLIDLGPEGGEAGGWVVATGAPEEVAMVEGSYTGQFLRKILPNLQAARTRRARRQPAAVAL